MTPRSAQEKQSGWTSRNSSFRLAAAKSCSAFELTSARRAGTNGSSNISIFGKSAGRQARHGPGDIDDAVARLIEQLRRRAAKLHRGKNIDANAAARLRLDLARPRRQEFVVSARHRRRRMVQLERDRRIGPAPGAKRPGPRATPAAEARKVRRATRIDKNPSRACARASAAAQLRRDGRSSSSVGRAMPARRAAAPRHRSGRGRRFRLCRRAIAARSRDRTASRTAGSRDRRACRRSARSTDRRSGAQ